MTKDPLSLEGIYYSHAIPRNPAVLTLMGLIFDRVHFPNAYMPTSDFDLKELDREIDRLAALPRNYETAELIGMLEFLKQVPVLEGFCQFLSDSSNLLNDNRFSQAEINRIYETIHGPSKPGWTPMISTAHIKGLPGSQESMIHRGEYHQFANSILISNQTGIPLINDVASLPIFGDHGSPRNDASALAGILSIQCMNLLLPEMPVMSPTDLMEFRSETSKELRSFRKAMLSFSAKINRDLTANATSDDVEQLIKFFVQTEVAPQLDDIRELSKKKSLSWIGRAAFKMAPSVMAGYLTGGGYSSIAAFITSGFNNIPSERKAADGKAEAAKSGLYYLLKVEAKIAAERF